MTRCGFRLCSVAAVDKRRWWELIGMPVKAVLPSLWRRSWVLAVLAVLGAAAVAASERNFPFDQELLLEVAPMRGSKRIPSIEVLSNGSALIDLWCASVRGRVRVEGTAISIVPHSADRGSCPPEHLQHDADMLFLLTQVTAWRREGDALVLIGPQILRYRVSAH